jgi:hypothetical protein
MSPDASLDPTNDQAFDAEQLRARYDGLAKNGEWGEHPNHPMKEWQAQVYCKNTRVGYWDWVVLKLAADEADAKSALADAEEEEIKELQATDAGNQGA